MYHSWLTCYMIVTFEVERWFCGGVGFARGWSWFKFDTLLIVRCLTLRFTLDKHHPILDAFV